MMSQQPCTKSGVAGSADNQTPRAGGLLGRILPKGGSKSEFMVPNFFIVFCRCCKSFRF